MQDPNLTLNHPRAIPVLKSARNLPCAKAYHRDPHGDIIVEPYGKEALWHVSGLFANNVHELEAAVRHLAEKSDSIVIRGGLFADDVVLPPSGLLRRLHGRSGGVWVEAPRQWVAFDFDGAVAPARLQHAGTRIQWVLDQLPKPWNGISCVWQWTSSYCVTRGPEYLRLRLWFWLSKPVDQDQLMAATASFPQELKLDKSIFRTVQPIYVAAPHFAAPLTDPVAGRRVGLLDGWAGDEVPADELAALPPTDIDMNGVTGIDDSVEQDANEEEIAKAIERLSTQITLGTRHHHALGVACELAALGCSGPRMAPVIDDLIRRQGREPSPSEVDGIVRHALTKRTEGTLKGAPPLAKSFRDAEAAEVADAGNEARIKGAVSGKRLVDDIMPTAYGKSDVVNAQIYARQVYPDGGFVRWLETDYEWIGAGYRALEAEEVLPARIQRQSGMSSTLANTTARSFRNLHMKEYLKIPCWLDDPEKPIGLRLLFRNGVLDVDKWLMDRNTPLEPHARNYFATATLPYNYQEEADCPRFKQFLNEVFLDDEIAKRELVKVLGYLMLPLTKFKKVFCFEGVKDSGKTTLLNVFKDVLGPSNVATPMMSDLSERFGAMPLIGKSAAFIDEANAETGKGTAPLPGATVDLIKAISGQASVQIDCKNKVQFNGQLLVRFVFAFNRAFEVLDASGAFASRLHILRFKHSAKVKDVDLPVRLRAEVQGIARLALEGMRWLLVEDGGFREDAGMLARRDALLRDQAPIRAFAQDCLVAVQPGTHIEPGRIVTGARLTAAWEAFCKREQLPAKQVSIRKMYLELAEAGFDVEKREWRRVEGKKELVFDAFAFSDLGIDLLRLFPQDDVGFDASKAAAPAKPRLTPSVPVYPVTAGVASDAES